MEINLLYITLIRMYVQLLTSIQFSPLPLPPFNWAEKKLPHNSGKRSDPVLTLRACTCGEIILKLFTIHVNHTVYCNIYLPELFINVAFI